MARGWGHLALRPEVHQRPAAANVLLQDRPVLARDRDAVDIAGCARIVDRAADTADPLGMPLQSILTSEAQRRINRAAYTKGSGAEQLANYFVGQVVGTMNVRKKSSQVVLEMVDEFIDATQALAAQLDA